MKRSPLPLLMGAVMGTQALLNGIGAWSPIYHDGLHALLGISAAHAEEAAAVKYTCPMHPQVISDTPGKCPICGMDLVPIAGSGHTHEMSAPAQEVQDHKALYWYDPMRPEQHFDKPGKSPFMDMELVPKYAEEAGTTTGNGGKPVVSISAENIQKMGVRIEKVSKGNFGGDLRATGIVAENERARRDVFSQVEGRVEDLRFNAAGDPVQKGDVFYTLVSPELTALQGDYIAALSGGLKDMAKAARSRMTLLGVDGRVLDTLAKTHKAYDKVPFYIPADGVLLELAARNGDYLKPGDKVARIEDLSSVWVNAEVSEQDLAALKAGDKATIRVSGNATAYDAKVDYIYPTVMAETRTGKVRLVVENKDGRLKPGGYATVEFAAATAPVEKLVVPSEAILRSSTGNHVIIALGEGKFQARDVETGAAGGGQTEILSGLKEGENVVVSSQFLIDSESSLKESLQKLSAPAAPKQSIPK